MFICDRVLMQASAASDSERSGVDGDDMFRCDVCCCGMVAHQRHKGDSIVFM